MFDPEEIKGILYSASHYNKKEFVRWFLRIAIILAYVLPFNPFFALPTLPLFLAGLILAEAINWISYQYFVENYGYLRGTYKCAWVVAKISLVYIFFVPYYAYNWAKKGAYGFEKFVLTVTGEYGKREEDIAKLLNIKGGWGWSVL